jgi:ABC-type phosphate transport system permease subunit
MLKQPTPWQWAVIIPTLVYGLWAGVLVVPEIVKVLVPEVVKAVAG